MTNFDSFATEIAQRQYMIDGEETVEDVLERAAEVVEPYIPFADFTDKIYNLMESKRFIPGGRILAGAGTAHGNLLNCFVQDESPYRPGTTEGVLHLAKKLAQVTRVGGGNGVNLDPIPAMQHRVIANLGTVYVTINPDHADAGDVQLGRYEDVVTGGKRVRPYKALRPTNLWPNYLGECICVPDSTEGIWNAAAEMVELIMKGQNVTLDLSELRPEGAAVSGSGGTSSGPASFAGEIFDNFAYWARLGGADYAGPVNTLRYIYAPTLRVIRQGGVRRGAGMATLSATHPDVMEFISAKTLENEKLYGDIGTFNISVLATKDLFVNPSLSTIRVFDAIAEQAHATGEPGLLFVDTINEHNPLRASDGPIMATNPCGEIGLYPGEPCDLGAINVSQYVTEDGKVQWDELRRDAQDAATYLDLILDAEVSPLPEITEAIADKRRIGLGMMGLGDAFIKLGIPYDTSEALDIAEALASQILSGALQHAANPYLPTPDGCKRARLNRRNIALVTVAPTGTTSMLAGTTSGIEPLFAPFIYRRVGTEYKKVLHPLFKEMLVRYNAPPDFAQVLEQGGRRLVTNFWDLDKVTQAISENHGSLQGLYGIPMELKTLFVCAHDIRPEDHVAMQAAVQRGFDWIRTDSAGVTKQKSYAANSISKTINLPHEATVEDVADIYRRAYYLGCKGITVYRDGSRQFQVLSTSVEEDDGSSEDSQRRDEQLEEIINASCSLDGSCDV